MELLVCSTFDEAKNAKGITIVKFFAPWCAPCRVMEKVYKDAEKALATEDIRFCEMNRDDNPEYCEKIQDVRALPTIRYYKDGELVKETYGMTSIGKIAEILMEIK